MLLKIGLKKVQVVLEDQKRARSENLERPLVVPRGSQERSLYVVVTWVGLDSTWTKFRPNLKFS